MENDKLLVATFTSGNRQKINSILRCISSYPEGVTPKQISVDTRINVNTVKSILPKLENVKKTMRGFYKVLEWGDGTTQSAHISELKTWNFHNCILSCQLSKYYDCLFHKTYNFNLTKLDLTINEDGKATLRLSSDYPLNVSSICLVGGFMLDILGSISKDNLTFNDINVQTIEFNKDFSNLRLDGIKSITLDSLAEQFKVYQKKLGLRVEHKTKMKFNVQNVVDMLGTNPNSLEMNIKLAKQQEQLDRLTVATSNHTKLLFEVIDRMKKKMET